MLGNRHAVRGSRVPTRAWIASLIALSVLASLLPAQPASSQDALDRPRPGPITDAASPPEVRTERLAIERVDGVSAAEVEAAAGLRTRGAEATESTGSGEDAGVAAKEAPHRGDVPRRTGGGYELLELGEPLTLAEAEALAERLVREGVATVAVPEYPMDIAWSVDDTRYPDQWHLHGEPSPWHGFGSTYGIRVDEAWSETTGSSDVVVAVLDTGVTAHADLVDRLIPGYDFIDDVPGGWDPGNYRLDGQCGNAPDAEKSDWHGLHVAGTIGATTDNGSGVAGVDQRARILPVRVLGPCGGSNLTVIDGIYWAAGAGTARLPDGVPVNPTPADVINLSLGSSTPAACDTASQAAIDFAVGKGITVVVAAGNSGGQASSYAPANCENVITVAATTPIGDRAYYTNTGPAVDIAAPGGDASFTEYGTVLSLLDSGEQGPESDTVGWKQGTSMAAPHVAGVVALLLSIDDTLSPADVAQVLRSTAQRFPDTGYPEYVCTTGSSPSSCGAGIVDAAQAVATLRYPPAVPTGMKATAGVGQVKVTWNASPGATRYQLFRRTSPCTNSNKGTEVYDGSSRSFTDKNLKAGATYHYCVRAWNRVGASVLSAAKAATPKAATVVPAAPSWGSSASLRFDLASSGVRLSWPAANGTVSHYQVQRGTTTVATTTSRSQTVTGLSTGRRTTLRVRAVNNGGASSWLSIAVTPTSGFRDVGSSNSFREDVRWLATAEITRGCNPPANDRFCPGSVVTREQMAAFLVRALGLTETSSRGNFRDVPSSNAFRTDINRLATAGITMGCNPPANTRFCPGSPVTREQMAAFLTRALELRSTSSEGNFRDVPSSNAFRGDINRLATAGITKGCNPPSNSRFCPKSHVTREQMAAFMRRALANG